MMPADLPDEGPKAHYLDEIKSGVIWRDELQALVVDEFERLYQDFTQSKKPTWSIASLWQRTEPAPKGLYIYGSVGRGKTHLMDLFYDSLPDTVGKKRQHYHEFMLWLHHQLRNQGDVKNPLDKICKQLGKQIQVLCLDEFLVNDIANAMLLAVMLQAFSRYGIALVTTSNVKPDNLYQDGLQRAQFLPAISWINTHMQVMHLDGDHDYRQQDQDDDQHEHWYYPINYSSQNRLQERFELLTDEVKVSAENWVLNDRQLKVLKFANRTLWCEFSALCQQARNADDYMTLAKDIDTLIIANIPNMSADNDNAARRFITLIDVLYEADVKIVAQAASHYKLIYQGRKMTFEFERAASRLAEMLV